MICVSDWYLALASYTFPTVFIQLTDMEINCLLTADSTTRDTAPIIAKLERAARILPGNSFLHADCCAPTDSMLYAKRKGSVNAGKTGWDILRGSEKAKSAFKNGATRRVALHPYRRMDRSREFRMFVKDGGLAAMCQRYLNDYYLRIHKRRQEIWRTATRFHAEIAAFLPEPEVVVDVYMTSAGELMIIDMNAWGAPTDPLLMRDWSGDWPTPGLELVTKPVKLKGDVSVSF